MLSQPLQCIARLMARSTAEVPALLLMGHATACSSLQPACSFHSGAALASDQQQQAKQQHYRPGTSRISSSHPRPKGFAAYRARLPAARRYGPRLRDMDPKAFEQMRLIVGYYDLPENRNKPRPAPPTHVTINNLQTLKFTHDVDPYYKLALLSYRSKLENLEILKGLDKTRAFLQDISTPPDFVPNLEGLAALGAGKQQQKQEQQQQPQQQEDQQQKDHLQDD